MPTQAEIQQQITARIIEGLKNGVVPWRSDKNSGSPASVISRRPYSGINPIRLDLVAMDRGHPIATRKASGSAVISPGDEFL